MLELTVDPETYVKTISEVDARESDATMGKEYSSRAKNGKTERETKAIREEGFKNMEARFVKSQAKFEKLKEMAKKLRRLPVAELETPDGGHGGSAKCREIEFGEERVERGTRSKQLSVYNEGRSHGAFFHRG